MNKTEVRILTDEIYKALFNMDTAALLEYYGLPQNALKDDQDTLLRDSMTLEALSALSTVETAVTRSMRFFDSLPVDFETLRKTTHLIAEGVALQLKANHVDQDGGKCK
jgi:hypothetical protein